MMGLSLSNALSLSSSLGGAVSSALALTLPVGDAGVTQGFTALSDVTGYTATAGRYRLGTSGFTECAANEERLCYNSDGTFRGQYLQGADTYYSAPWNDPAAPNTSSDPAYVTNASGVTIEYAGAHTAPDAFGGTGGGLLLTQGANSGGFHNVENVKATGVVSGDTIRLSAIVSIGNATAAGQIGIGLKNTFEFRLNHNAAGEITGFTENWNSYRIGYHDMGTINGERWWFIWLDVRATNTNDAIPRIGWGTAAADSGKTFHYADIRVQKNPTTAPAAVPVCAANKTFAADTLATSFSDAGYVCDGLAMARSQMPSGNIAAPAVPIGVPYEPLETRIGILEGVEAADRTGILHNANERYYNSPWKQPANFEVLYGPSYFPRDWVNATETARRCTNAAITPVFQATEAYAPLLGQISTSQTFITGTLTTDGCAFLGVGDESITEMWEQSSIRSSSAATFYLTTGTGVLARDCLVMGGTLHTTRARYEIQQDASEDLQTYVGEFIMGLSGTGTIDYSGSRFDRLARVSMLCPSGSAAVTADFSDTFYDLIWSDYLFWDRGTYTNAVGSRRFHGRSTSYPELSLFQSRKQIEVDTGSGFVDLSASGLSLEDLPHGYLAEYVGSYDFGTSTFTAGTDTAKTQRIRYWKSGSISSPIIGRANYEYHAERMDLGTHKEFPSTGDVFEIDTGTLKVRVYTDEGFYTSGNTWNAGTGPAILQTGTHADNVQVSRSNSVTINGYTADDVVYINRAQGDFLTGDPSLGASGASIDGVQVTRQLLLGESVSNAFRHDSSRTANSDAALTDAVFIQAASKERFTNGTGISMTLGTSGVNNTLTLTDVWMATPNTTGLAVSGGGTLVGTLNHIQLPAAQNYDEYTAPPASDGVLSDLLEASDIDPTSGQAVFPADIRAFRVAADIQDTVGWDVNATIVLAQANHARWDSVIADLASVYHREPDHYDAIADSAAVGTVVASGISASAFHGRYGGNGDGYFEIVGTEVRVAKSLSGLDRIFVLRGSNDETFVVDVS